ncbi:universal stress protein [Desulfurivibrio sp. C05AmB]|uniref:universal stress protein n=1 Tax=Desulfurivibrio sp. C05AmB TaxID=3374371 RepID=UPI00376EC1EB
MLNKILIATDFSPASDCLIQCAGQLKKLGLKQVVLAHVIYVANTPGLDEILLDEASPQMEQQKKRLEAEDLKVDTELAVGIAAPVLEALATSHRVDAILIGSRGRGLAKSALGSVSFKLLQITNHPVFLSRITAEGHNQTCGVATGPRWFEKILFATDFSPPADRAAAYLEQILRHHPTTVTLLHVSDAADQARLAPKYLQERQEQDQRRLEKIARQLAPGGDSISSELAIGNPAEEIIARTRTGQISLVVMGSHGKGFFREALLGSVANEVARRAEAPVLLVPGVR